MTRAEKTDQTQIENACLAACRSEAPFLLSEMASFVTHKAKNPLAGMMLLASRLKRNVPPGDELSASLDKLVGYVEALDGELNRIADLVPLPEVKADTLDANEALLSALSFFGAQLGFRRIEVEVKTDPRLPMASGDASLLVCAISKLIANAVEAMPVEGKLAVGTRVAEGGLLRIEIRDTGPGIDAAAAEKLFRPFVTDKLGHLGMGLPVARRIMGRLSGRLELEPGDGGGTRAVVTLPAQGRPPGAEAST